MPECVGAHGNQMARVHSITSYPVWQVQSAVLKSISKPTPDTSHALTARPTTSPDIMAFICFLLCMI